MTETRSLPHSVSSPSHDGERRVRIFLFLFVLLSLTLVSGARIVSSDEVSMYLTVESIVERGTLDIHAANPPNTTTFNGKVYTWYELGNILLGIPFYITGSALASVLPLNASVAALLPRATVSLVSAFLGACTALVFYNMCRRFSLHIRFAAGMAVLLIFSTFLLPYFKLYMREPVMTLCLTGGFYYAIPPLNPAMRKRHLLLAGFFVGYGVLTKMVFILTGMFFALYILWENAAHERSTREKIRDLIIFCIPVFLLGLIGTGIYNYVRYGNPLATGYPAAVQFTTPFYVGAYGLLLSPGKGLVWFAPMLLLLPLAVRSLWKNYKPEIITILGFFVIHLGLYSIYVAWGGDGSWGPRYLAPTVPLLFVLVALYVYAARRSIRTLALALAIVGGLIQLGGVSIYAGSYLREIGEYPYERDFSDPEFLYKSHFIPEYSPIVGHWRMLARNAGEHFQGAYPQLTVHAPVGGARLPIESTEHTKLQHTLDFWFTYALYSGISPKVIIFSLLAAFAACGMSGIFLLRAIKFAHS